jgi:6-phosphogluconolactonase (cycloisomerase 2 family)
VIDPSGLFAYVANDGSGDISVYAVDAATGALSAVGNSPVAAGNEPRSIAVD